jgi:hypothetical protein
MNAREQRGLVIAALCKINRTEEGWLVPSQSSGERLYRVNPETQTCTCPDHQEAGFKCKHLFAVEITMKRECLPDGTVIDTRSVTFTEKKTYTQNWPAYNLAQSTEKARLQALLQDICQGVQEPAHNGVGRKPHSIRDAIFAMAFKVYCGFSSRRFSTDLREAHEKGYLSKAISGLKVNVFFESPAFTPILVALIERSAMPLAVVEDTFAVDSTGFSSSKFERWYDHKYGVTRQRCVWVKAHVACGTRTNVITAIRILEKDTGDCPQLKPLMQTTAQSFTIKEMSADKAYISSDNFETVAQLGGEAFIAFKSNSTGGVGGLLGKMFHYFQFRQEEFMAHYHKRSNVESTFSAAKRKFGDSVRSKTDVAMVNEVLCKLLCHNLCCLIQEQCELGIEPVFWKDSQQPSTMLSAEAVS